MAAAIAPNLVHAMDACHLMLVALAAAAEAIPLVTVHDSFGTLAPYAARLQEIIREQFAKLSRQHNPLAEVLECAKQISERPDKLPALPARGPWEPEAVLESKYFCA